MTAGLPEPQPGYRWELRVPEHEPPRRRPWRWIVGVAIVAALMAGAWFAGEWLARDMVERAIRVQVIDALDLPADQQLEIEVSGAVLPQLIAGSLEEVRIGPDEVTFESLSGEVSVQATDVPVRGDAPLGGAEARVALDEEQLRALMATVDGFPADTLGIDAPEVTETFQLTLFGAAFPVGVGLVPGAADGALTLAPGSLRVGDAQVTADQLRAQFGVLAEPVLREWEVCVAEHLPAGLVLSGVAVEDDRLVADLEIDPDILRDPALQQDGACG